jgi:C4-dicarboxylate transporter DctM subunit
MSPFSLFGVVVAFVASGIPFFVGLGILSLILFWRDGRDLGELLQICSGTLQTDAAIAIPFIVMTATFMQRGGVAEAIAKAAYSWIGWMRGGLALSTLVAAVVFAMVCGTSMVPALAVGTVLFPAMIDKGHDRPFALGAAAAAGMPGILFAPSLAIVVYAALTGTGVRPLLLAALVPGLVLVLLIGIRIALTASRRGYFRGSLMPRGEFLQTNLLAAPALAIPVMFCITLYGGWLGIAEAAALAALLAMVTSLACYRSCKVAELPGLVAEAIRNAAGIMLVIAVSASLYFWFNESGIPERLAAYAVRNGLSAWPFLIFTNIAMLLLGMFLDVIAVILIAAPFVLPLLDVLGVDPVHVGIILIVNLELALMMPPLGLNLFIISSISTAPVSEIFSGIAPYLLILATMLAAVTFIPEFTLFLPDMIAGQ